MLFWAVLTGSHAQKKPKWKPLVQKERSGHGVFQEGRFRGLAWKRLGGPILEPGRPNPTPNRRAAPVWVRHRPTQEDVGKEPTKLPLAMPVPPRAVCRLDVRLNSATQLYASVTPVNRSGKRLPARVKGGALKTVDKALRPFPASRNETVSHPARQRHAWSGRASPSMPKQLANR